MKLKIVKIGGKILEHESLLSGFLDDLSQLEGPKVLVHGGGQKASSLATQLGIPVQMNDGRRVTCEQTLEVITMVYGGLLNKKVVVQLQSRGCDAIGLSGADANLIGAVRRPVADIDYGFAGDISQVNTKRLTSLVDTGLTPVFCAITHDGNGQLLNTNADTVAASLAVSLSQQFEVELYYCFELNGVLRDPQQAETVIPHINKRYYQSLIEEGVVQGGMLPKLHNCFDALEKGVKQIHIGSAAMIKNDNHLKTTLSL
ncbi:acetylglutamate kinase [Robertkochia aurantiaca]|uniref:acetylglutamate kinase n=1 Tax=Robertkochia aurantiaca TaxID=2873700 RepID=UPI001CCBCA8A